MSKNSTKNLWDLLSKEEYLAFDKTVHKILSSSSVNPRKETVSKILAYASSVRGVKIKANDKIIISLN